MGASCLEFDWFILKNGTAVSKGMLRVNTTAVVEIEYWYTRYQLLVYILGSVCCSPIPGYATYFPYNGVAEAGQGVR